MNSVSAAKESHEKSESLKIEGMTCASCALRIEKGLGKVEGVSQANVNYAMEKATVTYDPSKVDLTTLQAKVNDLGYKVSTEKASFEIMSTANENSSLSALEFSPL